MTLRTINLMKISDVKQLWNVYRLVIYTLTVLDMDHFLHTHKKISIYVEYPLYIIEGLTKKKEKNKYFSVFNVYEDFLSQGRHDFVVFFYKCEF